jgi:hypothetical protein
MEFFEIYTFVGLKEEKKENIVTNINQRTYFIREILSDGTYLCDIYNGENLIEKHYIVKLPTDKYEIKKIKATYKIREYYPLTATFVDNPKVYNTIQDAVSAGSLAPAFAIWGVSIICDSDRRSLGIDPAAPWPPKAI